MVIIAFAPKSSKLLPNIFCKHFRHCSVLFRNKNKFIMLQFVSRKHVEQIELQKRDIGILAAHGWRFIYLPCDIPHEFNPNTAWSCVNMAKHAIKMKSVTIQTPYALYKKLNG